MEELNAHRKSYMVEEWRECQNLISRLDKVIMNLRKFVCSAVVFFVAANVVFVTLKQHEVMLYRFHIVMAILLLSFVCLLFILDNSHQVYLRNTLKRAVAIEKKIDFDFSIGIFSKQLKNTPALNGQGFYTFLCFLSIVPSLIVTVNIKGFYDFMLAVMFIAFMLTLACCAWLFLWRWDKNN